MVAILRLSNKEVTNLRDRLKSIKVDENLQEKHNEIIKSLTASLKDFNSILGSVTQELKDHPMKKENVIAGADEIFNACKKVMQDLKRQHITSSGKVGLFNQCEEFLTSTRNNLIGRIGDSHLGNAKDIAFIKDFPKQFATKLANAIGNKKEAKNIQKTIVKTKLDALEQKEWKVIDKSFSVTCKNKLCTVTSKMTPAGKMPVLSGEFQ